MQPRSASGPWQRFPPRPVGGNTALTIVRNTGVMEQNVEACEHRWRYFVHVASRSVRVRECVRCRQRMAIAVQIAPLPQAVHAAGRLTA